MLNPVIDGDMIDARLATFSDAALAEYRAIIATPIGRDMQLAQNDLADAIAVDAPALEIRRKLRRADHLFARARRGVHRDRVSMRVHCTRRVRARPRGRQRRSAAARTRRTASRAGSKDSDGDGEPAGVTSILHVDPEEHRGQPTGSDRYDDGAHGGGAS